MAAAAFADPKFYDKNYLQYIGVRYINANLCDPGVEEMIEQWIVQLFRGGSDSNPGPRCDCAVNVDGVKCHNADCILHANKIECHPECGEECQNLTLTRQDFPTTLQLQPRDGYGIVLVTLAAIPEGLPVVEFIGRFQLGKIAKVPAKIAEVVTNPNKPNPLYCFPISRVGQSLDLYLNQEKESNESRFIAYSCQPNCEILEYIVGKKLRLMVVAIQDIEAGSVLTVSFPQIKHDGEKVQLVTVTEDIADNCERAGAHKDSVLWEARDRPEAGTVVEPKLKPVRKPRKGKKGKESEDEVRRCYFPRCNFRCNTDEELQAHIDAAHGPDKKFRCYYARCYFRYDTQEELLAHLEDVHTTEPGSIPDCMPKPSKKK